MKQHYSSPLFAMRRTALLVLTVAGLSAAHAQTTIVPQSVTASLEPFSPSCAVENLTLGITAATTVSTTFPYSPTSGFSEGIGYVSDYGDDVGSITYTFTTPVSISRMIVWNAFFDFELDHSMRNVQLVCYNASNTVIGTHNLTLPIATENNLAGYAANLPNEVLGVKRVVINVNTLWGGNEISVRRIAFAGNGLTTGIAGMTTGDAPLRAYPMPATDRVTLELPGIRSVVLLDGTGREVPAQVRILTDRAELALEGLRTGLYHAFVTTEAGTFSTKVLVAGE